jgi:glycosyltransferase involved in cell wall biosynthesis
MLVMACMLSKNEIYASEHPRLHGKIAEALRLLDQEDGCKQSGQVIQHLLIELCPQQKRVLELEERVVLAQKEMAGKVEQKQSRQTPLLSFVIPCYNRADVIGEVIQSIYDQHLSIPFEVIAIDDASKDHSFDVLLEYEKQYDNFFAFRNKENKKAPTTRNVGIAYARGKYICNADSDDVFEPDSIEPMLFDMIEKGYEVAFFEELRFFYSLDKKAVEVGRSSPVNHEIVPASMLREYYLAPCAGNRIITKQAWLKSGGYLEAPGHDSWAFSYKLLANGYKAYVPPGSWYHHRLWKDESNMWWDDLRKNVHDISPLQAVLESPELFTSQSFSLIERYQPCADHFPFFMSEGVKNGKLMIDKDAPAILEGYLYEHRGDYQEALRVYLTLLDHPSLHLNVYLRAIRVALHLEEKELAKQIIRQILRGKRVARVS